MASPALFRVNILWSLLKTIKAALPTYFSTLIWESIPIFLIK